MIVTAGFGGAPGIKWVEARDAAEFPTVPTTAPPSREQSSPDVHSVEVERACWNDQQTVRCSPVLSSTWMSVVQ